MATARDPGWNSALPWPRGTYPPLGVASLGGEADGLYKPLATAAELQRSAGLEAGTVPAGWLRWAEMLMPSTTDWRRVLAAEIRVGVARAAGMVDYSYQRPSRRGEV